MMPTPLGSAGQRRRSLEDRRGPHGARDRSSAHPGSRVGCPADHPPEARRRFPRHLAVAVQLGQALELDAQMSLADSTARLQQRIAELEAQASQLR